MRALPVLPEFLKRRREFRAPTAQRKGLAISSCAPLDLKRLESLEAQRFRFRRAVGAFVIAVGAAGCVAPGSGTGPNNDSGTGAARAPQREPSEGPPPDAWRAGGRVLQVDTLVARSVLIGDDATGAGGSIILVGEAGGGLYLSGGLTPDGGPDVLWLDPDGTRRRLLLGPPLPPAQD